MTYQVRITKTADKGLRKVETGDRRKIERAISSLASDPRPAGCKKLSGVPGWRIRVGNYRVVYEIEDTIRIVSVRTVGHRSSIYE